MKKIVLAVMLFVSLLKSEEINIWNRISDQYSSGKEKEDIGSEPSQSYSIHSHEYTSNKTKQAASSELSKSSSIVSNTPKCIYFTVEEVNQLNIRDKPGKPSNVVGKANNGEIICIYESQGKWGRSARGWLSMKYLSRNYRKSNFLLADIDNDGKKERLQWYQVDVHDYEGYYQLILFDDNGDLLWKSNDSMVPLSDVGGSMKPALLTDIDLDGNIELVLSIMPHEIGDFGFQIYRWDGKKFIKITKTKYAIDLVWTDAPNGNTLMWTEIDYKEYKKRKKIWSAFALQQMENNELPIVEIAGIKYPEYDLFFRSKAKIRFTPKGAVIKEWITSGKDTYEADCAVCHATDVMGSPAVGDKAAWAAVLEKGIDQVYHNAINGKGGMPPKGGAMNLTDAQVKEVVNYMVGASK